MAKTRAEERAEMRASHEAMIRAQYEALRYDYDRVPEDHRKMVMDATVQIKLRHQRIQEDRFQIGVTLLQVKTVLPHGQFGVWLVEEFELAERVAQGLMNVARRFGDGPKARVRALLNDSALRMLAAPSVPDEAVDEVIRVAEEQGHLTVAETQAIIDAHKPAPKMIEVKATKPAAFSGPTLEPADGEPMPGAEFDQHWVAGHTIEELAAIADSQTLQRTVRILTTGIAGEVNFEWHLEQASEQELAGALAIITEVENPEDFAEVRNKIATRLGSLMEARQVQEGQTGLLKRLIAVKDLLSDVEAEWPDSYRMTGDVRPPLNRLVTFVHNKMR